MTPYGKKVALLLFTLWLALVAGTMAITLQRTHHTLSELRTAQLLQRFIQLLQPLFENQQRKNRLLPSMISNMEVIQTLHKTTPPPSVATHTARRFYQ